MASLPSFAGRNAAELSDQLGEKRRPARVPGIVFWVWRRSSRNRSVTGVSLGDRGLVDRQARGGAPPAKIRSVIMDDMA
jgi:hypothetical protein